jgi:hypothetical protein
LTFYSRHLQALEVGTAGRRLREQLDVGVTRTPMKLPYGPTEAEVSAFYDAVWKARRARDIVLIKTLLYTGSGSLPNPDHPG